MRTTCTGWALVAQALFTIPTSSSPIEHKSDHGAVASESKICSEIGIKLLSQGGNAADALIGTTLCVGVIGMYHSGIGGGGFMLVRDSYGQYETIDFRETAPAAAYENMYEGYKYGSIRTGLASGVPSEIAGFEYVHRKYGLLPWRAVVNPAVHVARHGFPITEDLVRYMDFAMKDKDPDSHEFLVKNPQWAEDFAPDGKLLGLGDVITRKRYANTLEIIGDLGPRAFYEGPIAEAMINTIQDNNGTMTMEDLRDYQVAIRQPVSINYRGYKMTSTPTPSSGSVALSTFKTIEGYDMSDPALHNLNIHRLDEALRFAYAAHNELGDPQYIPNMAEFEVDMLKTSTANMTRSKINDDTSHNVSYYDPKGLYCPETAGTSHVVTADKSGMTITLTTTINLLFGSQLIVPEYGIILNNEMNDFSIPGVRNEFGFVPSVSNYIRPGKRPLSSITPIIVEYPDGSLYISTGAAGGSRIITATIQTLWHILDHGMNMLQALTQPRIHEQLMPDTILLEQDGFSDDTIAFLQDRGHKVAFMRPGLSSAQGIRRLRNGTLEAAGEPRQKNSGGLAI